MWRVILIASILFAHSAHAVRGVCGDRPLPPDRIRQLRNLRLECTSGVDHFIRTSIPFDVDAWREAEMDGDRDEMQKIAQAQPLIRWQGTIVYSTIERWEWTDWVYGQDPVCGYDIETHTDSKGNFSKASRGASSRRVVPRRSGVGRGSKLRKKRWPGLILLTPARAD